MTQALYVVSPRTSEVLSCDLSAATPELEIHANSGGVPKSIAFDGEGSMLLADQGHNSICMCACIR